MDIGALAPGRASAPEHSGRRTGLPYLGALDGLRGIAVLVVVAHHTRFFLIQDAFLMPRGGFLGVDMFFVISGFLITALLLVEDERHDSISLPGFYWRRVVRLMPALLPVLLVHLIYTTATGIGGVDELATIGSALGFVSNWWRVVGGGSVPGLGHLWSLAVEEQFYLIWPAIVIVAIRRRRFPVACALIGAGLIGSMLWRAVLFAGTEDWVVVYIRTGARADQLLLGALIAVLWFHRKLPTGVSWPAWLGAAFLGVAVIVATPMSPFLYYGGFTLVAAATGAVLVACLDDRWVGVRVLELKPLRTIGRVSYGLYLWHEPVLWAVSQEAGGLPLAVRIVMALAIAALLTALSWHLLEKRAMRLKHRFGAHSRQVASPTTSPAERRPRAVSVGDDGAGRRRGRPTPR